MDINYIDRLLDQGDFDDERFTLRLAIRHLTEVLYKQQNQIKTIAEDLKSLRNNTNAILTR